VSHHRRREREKFDSVDSGEFQQQYVENPAGEIQQRSHSEKSSSHANGGLVSLAVSHHGSRAIHFVIVFVFIYKYYYLVEFQ